MIEYTMAEKYIPRDMDLYLLKWKETKNHLPLLVKGARQVGKSETIYRFGKKNYKYCLYIDFTGIYADLFIGAYENIAHGGSVTAAIKDVAAKLDLDFVVCSDAIIILDEIQEYKKIFEGFKTIYHELNCDIIMTGSCLRQEEMSFDPIGAYNEVTMYPISFKEYANYKGMLKTLESLVYSESELNSLYSLYRTYCLVGGYPKAIVTYECGGDLDGYFDGLLTKLYREFSSRMSNVDSVRFKHLLRSIIAVLIREKRGNPRNIETLSEITRQYNSMRLSKKEVMQGVVWLLSANILTEIDKYDFTRDEVFPNERLYITDVGLCNYIGRLNRISTDTLTGMLAETFVNACFCYNKIGNSCMLGSVCFGVTEHGELDFVLGWLGGHELCGVEVKAGDADAKTLKDLLRNGKLTSSILFRGEGNVSCSGNNAILPIFCASIMDRHIIEHLQDKIEKSASLNKLDEF